MMHSVPTGKNTRFHQELQRNLVIVPKISAHLLGKSAIYISALCVLRYGLVCSVAPRFRRIEHCAEISAQLLRIDL